MDYSRPRAPRLAHSRLSPSVSPAELYFLIARFLEDGPCQQAAQVGTRGRMAPGLAGEGGEGERGGGRRGSRPSPLFPPS